MSEKIKKGDTIRDNDPRMRRWTLSGYIERDLKVMEVLPNGVAAKDSAGKIRLYLMKSIHTDGKPRKSGFSLLPAPPEAAP